MSEIETNVGFQGGIKSDWQGTQIIYVEGEGYKIIIDLGSYSYALDLPKNLTLKDISNYYDSREEPKATDDEEKYAREDYGIPTISISSFESGFLNGDKLVSVPAGILDIEGDAYQIANNFLTAAENNRRKITSRLLADDEYINNLAGYYIANNGDMAKAIVAFEETDLYGAILDRLQVTQAQLIAERSEFTDPVQFEKNLSLYTDIFNQTAMKTYGSKLPENAVYYLADMTRRGYFTQQEAIMQMQGVFDPYADVTLDSGLVNALSGQTISTTTDKETEVQNLLDTYLPKHLQGQYTSKIGELAGKMRNNALFKDNFINELKDRRYQFYDMYDREIDWASIVTNKKENAAITMGVNLKDDDPLLDKLIKTNDYGKELELMREEGLNRGYAKVKNDLAKAAFSAFGEGIITSRSFVG